MPDAKRITEEATTMRLINIARDIALELHPHLKRTLTVELDSDLDRDLGLDSLGRAELLLRIDRDFKVRLPERYIGDATTLRDLFLALLNATPETHTEFDRTTVEPIILPKTLEPTRAKTILEVLATHTKEHGERPHIHLWQSEFEEIQISYSELEKTSRAVAHGLLDIGITPGDRVAIMLPTGKDYFVSFIGTLMATGIPVPIYPPFRRTQVENHIRRQARILNNAQASILITDQEIRKVGTLLYGLVPSLNRVTTVTELVASGETAKPRHASGDDTALIQYTSGSTGDPKGVVLSHENLLTNIRAMGSVLEVNSSDTFVSWLPLYHDMGLIGAWLGSLYYGVSLVIMPPLAFLADPSRWLWTIHKHRATMSAAPNFAFELCLKNIRDEDIEGLDLSCLRRILNGAEPVSPQTVIRFTERFARYGFPANALGAVYGLAESSVGLAFPPLGRPPIIDHVKRNSLSGYGLALEADINDSSALDFVDCGQPLPGHEIRIVDDTGREVSERQEGHLQFRGPSITSAYFNNEEKTRALFKQKWADSGDLAYVAKGNVFITGRVKDVIIRSGRNIYPHELEELVGKIEGVRRGCVVAFASTDERGGPERLVIIAETRETNPQVLESLRRKIIDASLQVLDMPPDDLVLAPIHTIPKTSSGKLRRSAARAIYEKKAIGQSGAALWWQLARLTITGLKNRLRRSVRTAGSLIYAAYWWGLHLGVALFTWILVFTLPRRRWRHNLLHYTTRFFLTATSSSFKIEIDEPLPHSDAILVANHSSYLDAAVLCAMFDRNFTFIAKKELESQLVAGNFLRRIGTIFVSRTDPTASVEDTAETLQAAKKGELLVAFPEGTLTRMPGLLDFRLGAFLVAAQARIPVIPVTIVGTRSILRGEQWFPRYGSISIHIGKAIFSKGTDFDAAIELRDTVRAKILERCHEPNLAGEKIEF